jgi:hypothetical protein
MDDEADDDAAEGVGGGLLRTVFVDIERSDISMVW